ncbi:hypothetical protein OC845_000715 [Tilletia horrida]|nr:hypothetical protein OC845_000715 [Tilletia horrida]
MSYVQRIAPVFLASFVGVATGVYVFKPLLLQYRAETHGTWKPENIDLKVDEATAEASKQTTTSALANDAAPAQVAANDGKTASNQASSPLATKPQ